MGMEMASSTKGAKVKNVKIDAQPLLPVLLAEYTLPADTQIEYVGRGFNDHYLVRAGADRFVLRVYFDGKYYIESHGDFRFELELLEFLHTSGIPVSHALRRRDGDLLGVVSTSGGRRAFALFTFAEGEERARLTSEQAHLLGEQIAALHLAADRFRAAERRYHLDEQYLLEQPLLLMEEFLAEHGRGGLRPYREQIEPLRAQLAALPKTAGAYGILHGDLHNRNFRVRRDGEETAFLFYDFDHGGYGWRAYDLATCLMCQPEEAREALLQGYQNHRPLSEVELASLPLFRKVRPIWDIGDVLAMRSARGESQEFGTEYADRILGTLEKSFGRQASP